ncbi:MAG: hypothetical protein JO060_00215 [Candidatus Eremiobacteraeota bacterium]|nr:hypothetical protein [Candidatus Eremiobacteraeota bacterium]
MSKLGPTNETTEGESEEAEQQERSPDGGATSGCEMECRAAEPEIDGAQGGGTHFPNLVWSG